MIPVILAFVGPFLKKHWKPVAVVAALVLAFFIGWIARPVPPPETVYLKGEEREKIVAVVDERLVEEEVARRVRDIEMKLRQRVEETTVTKPDGTKIETKITDTSIDSKEKVVEDEKKKAETERVVTVEVEKERVVTVEVETPKKDWLVGPMVGLDVRGIGIQDGALSFGKVGFGAQVHRRIAGPVFVGAYGIHTGQAGLTVAFEF